MSGRRVFRIWEVYQDDIMNLAFSKINVQEIFLTFQLKKGDLLYS